MSVDSTGRIEVPNQGMVDVEFDNQENVYGFQIHTSTPMLFTGLGFSPDQAQSGPGLHLKRPSAGVAQLDATEIDGALYINTAPVPFYRKSGTHKIHVENNSGAAGYVTIFVISGNYAQPAHG